MLDSSRFFNIYQFLGESCPQQNSRCWGNEEMIGRRLRYKQSIEQENLTPPKSKEDSGRRIRLQNNSNKTKRQLVISHFSFPRTSARRKTKLVGGKEGFGKYSFSLLCPFLSSYLLTLPLRSVAARVKSLRFRL